MFGNFDFGQFTRLASVTHDEEEFDLFLTHSVELIEATQKLVAFACAPCGQKIQGCICVNVFVCMIQDVYQI